VAGGKGVLPDARRARWESALAALEDPGG
jgi:hypothetical protein